MNNGLFIKMDVALRGHRKVKRLATALAIPDQQVLGGLYLFWCDTLVYNDSGDITNWDETMFEDFFGVTNKEIINILIEIRFIDRVDDKLLVHDWLDIAGNLLRRRYKSRRPMLEAIYKTHGKQIRDYHKEEAESESAPHSDTRTPQPSDTVGWLINKFCDGYKTNYPNPTRKEFEALVEYGVTLQFLEQQIDDRTHYDPTMNVWDFSKEAKKLWDVRKKAEIAKQNEKVKCPSCGGQGYKSDKKKVYIPAEKLNPTLAQALLKDDNGFYMYEAEKCDNPNCVEGVLK